MLFVRFFIGGFCGLCSPKLLVISSNPVMSVNTIVLRIYFENLFPDFPLVSSVCWQISFNFDISRLDFLIYNYVNNFKKILELFLNLLAYSFVLVIVWNDPMVFMYTVWRIQQWAGCYLISELQYPLHQIEKLKVCRLKKWDELHVKHG